MLHTHTHLCIYVLTLILTYTQKYCHPIKLFTNKIIYDIWIMQIILEEHGVIKIPFDVYVLKTILILYLTRQQHLGIPIIHDFYSR